MAPKFKRAATRDEFVTEKCDVVANKLLGDYNANGIYVINKKVAAELLDLKKAKKESYNNEIFCTSKTTSGKIVDFDISFKKNSASQMAVAELYVLEGVPKQGGRLMNVIKTPIAKFTQELSPNFVDLALAKFNVVINASDEGQEVKDVNDTYIVKRNILLGYLDNMTADSYNIVYEDFFTQRINLLKSMNNAYSKKVLAIFNEEFNKMSEFFLIDKKNRKVTNYKAMNELLDKAFEDLEDLDEYKEQEKMFKERILPILTMFIQGAERINSSAMKSVLDTVPKRLKDTLTEPLIDKKQAEESRMEPTVKETSKQTLKREIDESLKNVETGLGKVKGKGRRTKPAEQEAEVTTDQTYARPSTPSTTRGRDAVTDPMLGASATSNTTRRSPVAAEPVSSVSDTSNTYAGEVRGTTTGRANPVRPEVGFRGSDTTKTEDIMRFLSQHKNDSLDTTTSVSSNPTSSVVRGGQDMRFGNFVETGDQLIEADSTLGTAGTQNGITTTITTGLGLDDSNTDEIVHKPIAAGTQTVVIPTVKNGVYADQFSAAMKNGIKISVEHFAENFMEEYRDAAQTVAGRIAKGKKEKEAEGLGTTR